jgi:hypothetical protein
MTDANPWSLPRTDPQFARRAGDYVARFGWRAANEAAAACHKQLNGADAIVRVGSHEATEAARNEAQK